jgi:ferritin-like metal-binding protein YciE
MAEKKNKMDDLQSLYKEELKDAYDFEQQLLKALPKMEKHASDDKLKEAFRLHLKQTEGQVERLEQVFEAMGEKPARKPCKGMKGLIAEGEDHAKELKDNALDAALIAAAQRVEHYEISAYGTLCAYAKALGHQKHISLLQATLDEEKKTDQKLTRLAEARINQEAAAS